MEEEVATPDGAETLMKDDASDHWGERAERSVRRKSAEAKAPQVSRSYIVVVSAGAADAADQPVHHLDGTESALQDRHQQQGEEQGQVELHHVLWFYTPVPDLLVIQVATGAARHREGGVSVTIPLIFLLISHNAAGL